MENRGAQGRWQIGLLLILVIGVCFAQATVFVNDVSVHKMDKNTTEVKLLFAEKPKIHYFTLTNPSRLVVNIDGGHLKKTIPTEQFKGTLVKALRQGNQPHQVLRLVFDLNSDASVNKITPNSKTVEFELRAKKPVPSQKSAAVVAAPSVKKMPVVETAPKNTAADTAVVTPIKIAPEDTADTRLDSAGSANKGISTAIQQDSMLLVVGQLKSFYSFNEDQAAAFELDGGPRVFRGNGTYAYALNDKNRVKLTGEYLREDLDFEFYTGDTRQWVQQGAVGAAYEYLLGDGEGIFKNIDVGSHYSHAQSKDLSTQTIGYPDGSILTDYRRIAGGNDLNGNAEAGMQLWKDGVVTVGPDYDRVRYDTEYEYQDGHNAQGFGGHVRLDQKLKNNLDLQLNSTVSQLFETYGVGLNWLWSSNQKTALTAGITSSYTQDFTTERNFWINGVNLNVVWDAPEKQKSSAAPSKNKSSEGISQWVQTPAVRMPDVLAISDERITITAPPITPVVPFVSVTGACPAGSDVEYGTRGTYSAQGGWYQSYPQGSTAQAGYISLDSSNIMASPSGQAACLYNLIAPPPSYQSLGYLILENTTYQNVDAGASSGWTQGYSQFWPGPPYPSSFCNTLSGDSCTFSTVAPN